MPSIITSKFRVANARAFRDSITLGNSKYYLTIGRQMPWVDESSPPAPEDDEVWSSVSWGENIAAKRVGVSDVVLCVPKNEWVSGSVYNPYTNGTNDNFYIITDEYKIYKCLYYTGNASTVKPTSTNTPPFVLGDGYMWKYMGTVSTADALKFATSDFIPVRDDPTVQSAAVAGAIYSIEVVSGGSGYSSAPTVVITGDGSSVATATAVISSGAVTRITMTAYGVGYTVVNVALTGGGGTGATATAVLPPAGGHGSDIENELQAHTVCVSNQLSEDLQDFPTVNDYRRLMLVVDPFLYNSSTIAAGSSYDLTYGAKIVKHSGSDALPMDVVGTGAGSQCLISLISAAQVSSSPLTYNIRYTRDIQTNFKHPTVGEIISFAGVGSWTVSETYILTADKRPDIEHNTGSVVFVDQRRPIMRSPEQTETIIMFISFGN